MILFPIAQSTVMPFSGLFALAYPGFWCLYLMAGRRFWEAVPRRWCRWLLRARRPGAVRAQRPLGLLRVKTCQILMKGR